MACHQLAHGEPASAHDLFFLFLSSDLSAAFLSCTNRSKRSSSAHTVFTHCKAIRPRTNRGGNNQATPKSHHDDEDADEDSHEVGEEGQGVLDVVHVTMVRPLDDLLRVVHHVAQEDQQPKVNLQVDKATSSKVNYYTLPAIKTPARWVRSNSTSLRACLTDLKHEAASGVAKDGGGEMQPEQDGEARREQPTKVEVLPALGHDGSAGEAREGNSSPNKCCHQDAGKHDRSKRE